ncbi:hypothetical protein [Spiroplasma endosymbiont of Poecilobothrus nobilitatus]|uniref:hypothetical protein n=1 Tax=Spiroplasma endosymbiont of Poecilobothrus nobilitatus TaxID=1209220 RepID=UPI00313D462F
MATFNTILNETKAFLDKKGDKLSNKRAYLYYLKLSFDNWENKVAKKTADFIKDTINELEIEQELSLLNDRYGGGKKIYFDKYVNDINNNQQPIIVNLQTDIRDIKKESDNNA